MTNGMSAMHMHREGSISTHMTCRHCGVPVSEIPHLSERGEYCCESCFLNAQRIPADQEMNGDATTALAEALVSALDARERESGLHSKRVACHTLVLAKHFSDDPHQLRQIYCGALLHDIGKIGIPDPILQKNGSLTDAEWQIMRMHPEIGHRILSGATFMAEAAEIVLYHEERYDGTGYPRQLTGNEIPFWARLFAVIDTLDAMTSDRPYRKALSFDIARNEILRQSGTQFDPMVMEVFVSEEQTLRTMVAVKCSIHETGKSADGNAS